MRIIKKREDFDHSSFNTWIIANICDFIIIIVHKLSKGRTFFEISFIYLL